eukprot:scaffold10715_cov145-Skeletonema_menzelii.AAC.1
MAKSPQKKTPTEAAPAAAVTTTTATMKRIGKLDDLDLASNNLQITLDESDRQRVIQINKLEEKDKYLRDRLTKLAEEKLKTASANGKKLTWPTMMSSRSTQAGSDRSEACNCNDDAAAGI